MGNEHPVPVDIIPSLEPVLGVLQHHLVNGAAILFAWGHLAVLHLDAGLQVQKIRAQRGHSRAAAALSHVVEALDQKARLDLRRERAHALGYTVAAHTESTEGVRIALQNGVDSIEHGAQPSDEMITLFKQRKAFQISTISPALPYALFDRSISHATYEQQENGKIVFDGIVALAKANLAAGVPVGLGTDVGCPYITHYDMWRELHYFVKYCGVTPAFALYSATKLNTRLAGIGDLTGSIEADKQADLIVCSGNPLQNLSALRELDMVVKGGYRIDKPQIKKMDEIERELDKFL